MIEDKFGAELLGLPPLRLQRLSPPSALTLLCQVSHSSRAGSFGAGRPGQPLAFLILCAQLSSLLPHLSTSPLTSQWPS